MKYIGRVKTVTVKDGKPPYGFIDIHSVKVKEGEDGSGNDLDTSEDIFLHSAHCDSPLRVDMTVEFYTEEDKKRGKKHGGTCYRAGYAVETPESQLEGLIYGGITINVQGAGGTHVLEHSMVFANWCISPEVAGEIRKKVATRAIVARLLIIQWKSGNRRWSEERQLVDLAAPMTTIAFESPGTHRIVATIVFDKSESQLKDELLKKYHGKYSTDIISDEGSGIVLREGWCGSGCIDVEVPETLFAAQPRDWGWVNGFFETKPRDQCAFRRRRLFAYSIGPFIVMGIGIFFGVRGVVRILLKLWVFLLLLSLGIRGINFAPLRHPIDHLEERILSVTDGAERSIFIPVISGKHIVLPLAISPIAFAIYSVFAFILSDHATIGSSIWLSTFAAAALVITTLLVIATFFLIWIEMDPRTVAEIEHDTLKQRVEDDLEKLLCRSTTMNEPDVRQLPIRPRTVRFFAAALKQQICKGFAQ